MKNKIASPLALFLTQRSFLALGLAVIISTAVDAEDDRVTFDPMDVFELEWATDPRVSPDGKTIVYVRNSNDIMKDRQRSNLWQVSTNGKNHRPLFTGLNNSSSPRWSPNSKRLAFLSNNSGSQQIHMPG